MSGHNSPFGNKSPPRKRRELEPQAPPSARSAGTTGTRYSAAAPVNLNFKLSPSRVGEPPPSYTVKYAPPEALIYGGFQSKSVEKRAMEDAENKLAMLLFDTEFQKKLKEGDAEAKAFVENLERLKRGEFKNGNFPKPMQISLSALGMQEPIGQPPSLAPLRLKKLPLINENSSASQATNMTKSKLKRTRKRKQFRKQSRKQLKNHKHK
jgi:hypothetical protein